MRKDILPLQSDVKYGHRILHWHDTDTHKVTLHVGILPEFIHRSALLLLNGDIPHVVGNQQGLELGFQLWKRNAHALVARHSWRLEKKSHNVHDTTINDDLFVTLCNNESLELTTTNKNDQDDDDNHASSLRLVDPSGLWIHSNVWCIVKPLLLLENGDSSWFTTLIVVWMQVAQVPIVHLYPARLPTTNENDIPIQDNEHSWIDTKLLNGLVHDFGGIPAFQPVTWCGVKNGAPMLCNTTIRIAEKDSTQC